MPDINLGSRPFTPNEGIYEVVYHNEGGVIWAAKLLPKSVNPGANIYAVDWYSVNQDTGELIGVVNSGHPALLSPICFKNSFQYAGYVPSNHEGLIVSAHQKDFAAKSISRTYSYDAARNFTLQAISSARVPGSNHVYRIQLEPQQEADIKPGDALQRYDTLFPVSGEFGIVRSVDYDIVSGTLLVVLESANSWLNSAASANLYFKGLLFQSTIALDHHNPFNGYIDQVKIKSCNPLDKCYNPSAGLSNCFLLSDKWDVQKPAFCAEKSVHVPGSEAFESIQSSTLGHNCYAIWFDGVWNMACKGGSANIKIFPTSGPMTNVTYLEGIARILSSGGPYGNGYFRFEHADVPGSSNTFFYNAPISWSCSNSFVIEFDQPAKIYFGALEEPLVLSSGLAEQRRICLPASVTATFLSGADKSGVQIDNRGTASSVYCTIPTKTQGLDRMIIESYCGRNHWSASQFWDGAITGLIFLKSFGANTTASSRQNSAVHIGSRWLSSVEQYDGPFILFENGMAQSQSDYGTERWFDHRFVDSFDVSDSIDYRSASVKSKLDKFCDEVGLGAFDYAGANIQLSSNRWQHRQFYAKEYLTALTGSATSEGFVLFGKRMQPGSYINTGSFKPGARFKQACRIANAQSIDSWSASSNLTHLLVSGKPEPSSFTFNYSSGWVESFRSIHWDGTAWVIASHGGGDNFRRGGWLVNSISATGGFSSVKLISDDASFSAFSGLKTTSFSPVYAAPHDDTFFVLGGNSASDARFRSWVDSAVDRESNYVGGSVINTCHLQIVPSAESKLQLTGSMPQQSQWSIRLGSGSFSFYDRNPANPNANQINKTIYGESYSLLVAAAPNLIEFQQPKQFVFKWDKDADTSNNPALLACFATDGTWHEDLIGDNREIGAKTFSDLKDWRINGLITMPNFNYVDRRGYKVWEVGSEQAMLSGNKTECPTLISAGKPFIMSLSKAEIEIQGFVFKYMHGDNDIKSIPSVSRSVILSIQNNSFTTISLGAGDLKVYLVDSLGNRIKVAQNIAAIGLAAGANVVEIPHSAQVPSATGNYSILVDLNGEIETEFIAQIVPLPAISCSENPSNSYNFIIDSDAAGQIRDILPIHAGLLNAEKKQSKHTESHQAKWYMRLDKSGEDVFPIAEGCSFRIGGVEYGVEECTDELLISGLGQASLGIKTIEVDVVAYVTGIIAIIPVNVNHSIEVTPDIAISASNVSISPSNDGYAQDEQNLNLFARLTKNAGSADIINGAATLNWSPNIGNPFNSQTLNFTNSTYDLYASGYVGEANGQEATLSLNIVGRDSRYKPISISQAITSVTFYNAPQLTISQIKQMSNGNIRCKASWNTGIPSDCSLRVRLNGKMALIVSAQKDDDHDIEYGHSTKNVVSDRGIVHSAGTNSTFGKLITGQRYNPSFDETSDWTWSQFQTEFNSEHSVVFEMDAKHWAYHGGKTSSNSNRSYNLGLAGKQGPVEVSVDLQTEFGQVSASSWFNYSYKKPRIDSPSLPIDNNFASPSGIVSRPSVTYFAAQNAADLSPKIEHTDFMTDRDSWDLFPSGNLAYVVSPQMQGSRAGLYLRVSDGFGNYKYDTVVRPHDIDIPSNLEPPNVLQLVSGANSIGLASSLILDTATKTWGAAIEVNGVEQDSVIESHTNFYGEISSNDPAIFNLAQSSLETSFGYDYYGRVIGVSPNLIIVNGSVNISVASTTGVSVGDYVGVNGYFNSATTMVASSIEVNPNPVKGLSPKVVVFDTEIQQNVIEINAFDWNQVLTIHRDFYANEKSLVAITYKLPPMAAVNDFRRTQNKKVKCIIEYHTWQDEIFTSFLNLIDDGNWNTSYSNIPATDGMIKFVTARIYIDNADYDFHSPVRDSLDNIEPVGYKFRVSSIAFLDDIAAQPFVQSLPCDTLTGSDFVRLSMIATDYAGNEARGETTDYYYVKPATPTGLIVQNTTNDLVQICAAVTGINVGAETSTEVLYRVGYSENHNLSNPVYLTDWVTAENIAAITNELIEGHTYTFFVYGKNPHGESYSNVYTQQFKCGYVTPIITNSSHLNRAIHSYQTGSFLENDRESWEQGDRQKLRSSNPVQTNQGYHFKSRWYDGTGWMPNISSSSLTKSFSLILWDVEEEIGIEEYYYSVTYGAATKLYQPNLEDSLGGNIITGSFDASYRGYAYLHIRPSKNGVLAGEKHTIHCAFYLEHQNGVTPLPGEIELAYADGVDADYFTEPDWDSLIYNLKVKPRFAFGLKDSSNLYEEDEQGIRWRMLAYEEGEVSTGLFNSTPWTYNGSSPDEHNYPRIFGLKENTQYLLRIQAYSEGGAVGQVSQNSKSVYTNIRPAQSITSIKAIDRESAGVVFPAVSGSCELWDFANNSSLGFIEAGDSTKIINVPPAKIISCLIKSFNGDGVMLNPYPFRLWGENDWTQRQYAYMHPVATPELTVYAGYKTGGKYFFIKPNEINADTINWYGGDKLIADQNPVLRPVNNFVEYAIKIYKKVEGVVEAIGYLGANSGEVYASPVWMPMSRFLGSSVVFDHELDPIAEYGFSAAARKTSDVKVFGSNNALASSQLTVTDEPAGDQTLYSGWSNISWHSLSFLGEEDYPNSIHLATKWNYRENYDLTYSDLYIFQDITDRYESMKDIRLSYKILSSQTSILSNYPSEVQNIDNPILLPQVFLLLSIFVCFDDSTNVSSPLVLWTNNNLNNNKKTYNGNWGNFGLTSLGAKICDNFAEFDLDGEVTLSADQWYHLKLNLYSRIVSLVQGSGRSMSEVSKVRIAAGLLAQKGSLYQLNQHDSWKKYDEAQIGVLLRNISVGWTEQTDLLGRKLYDETSWNGKYYWQVANFALKPNNNFSVIGNMNNDFLLSNVAPRYIEKQASWESVNEWNYDSYIKTIMEERKTGINGKKRF